MRRREVIKLLGGAAAAPVLAPFVARAQQPMPVIGFLHQGAADAYVEQVDLFKQGLKDTGFVNGQNVAIEYRWAEGRYDRLPAMAADLVKRRVAVITAALLPAAQAAKSATTTIPIVFHVGSDPVKVGLVSNFKRPEGNLTGFTRLTAELTPKRLELLRELLPTAKTVAFLVNTANPNAAAITRDAQEAARKLTLQLRVVPATTASEIDAAFADLAGNRPDGLLIGGDAFFNSHSERIVALAARDSIPTMHSFRKYTEAGGLISYGVTGEIERQVGVYVGRILKGAKPEDLPAQRATKVELILNLKTAKTLGLTIPNSLLGRADQVIE